MPSFAQETKDALCEIPVKTQCCRTALLYGLLQFSAESGAAGISHTIENENVVSLYEMLLLEALGGICDIDYYGQGYRLNITDPETRAHIKQTYGALNAVNDTVMKCENCRRHYFRGAFLCAGTLNSPDAAYHLEIESPYATVFPPDMLGDIGIVFKSSNRRGSRVLYLKESEAIEDFLNYIGARSAAFTLMNEKIRREIRNNANRQSNFDTANIRKSVSAGARQLEAIKQLDCAGKLGMLPEELRITAQLRLEHPDAGLAELAGLHNPAITKSGLYHRLTKILDFAQEQSHRV